MAAGAGVLSRRASAQFPAGSQLHLPQHQQYDTGAAGLVGSFGRQLRRRPAEPRRGGGRRCGHLRLSAGGSFDRPPLPDLLHGPPPQRAAPLDRGRAAFREARRKTRRATGQIRQRLAGTAEVLRGGVRAPDGREARLRRNQPRRLLFMVLLLRGRDRTGFPRQPRSPRGPERFALFQRDRPDRRRLPDLSGRLAGPGRLVADAAGRNRPQRRIQGADAGNLADADARVDRQPHFPGAPGVLCVQ